MPSDNPYLSEVHANLPRLLALFDRDPLSPTLGMGDRLYWAWKLKDFGNGTFQGAAHGLARLISAGLLPAWLPEASVMNRIEAMFTGARRLTRGNGSLEEAFPYESSFCVTALVAYDLLSCVALLSDRIGAVQKREWLAVVAPMIGFLQHADETHALISNHLATAVAALLQWQELGGEPVEARARMLLDRIFAHASPEGWFKEYEGADPGYQTLALYYLADVARLRPDWGLVPRIAKACEFLCYFVHPDGSFAGLYGSRDTRFFWPGGIECWAPVMPAAAALALAMRESIGRKKTVTLSAVDESNLVPFFNSYCKAAAEFAADTAPALPLPSATKDQWRQVFTQAGLLVQRGADEYTVVSWHKGGLASHFTDTGEATLACAASVVAPDGRVYSAQFFDKNNRIELQPDSVTIRAELRQVAHQLPTPGRFLILRMLNLTVMRLRAAGEMVKRLLVRFLITPQRAPVGQVIRTIRFSPGFSVEDRIEGNAAGWTQRPTGVTHGVIHMASRGYWQQGDDSR